MKGRDGNEFRPVPTDGHWDMTQAALALLKSKNCGDLTVGDLAAAISNAIAAAPQFVAGEVDDAVCERIGRDCAEVTVNAAIMHAPARLPIDYAAFGAGMIAAVRSELGPALGLVEIREPSDDECRNIWRDAKANEGDGSKVCAGRAMFTAVSKCLKGEL